MNTDIFKQRFFDEFALKVEKHLEEKKLPRRALLLIDNAPSHPEVEDLKSGNIKAMFLPVNITSLIQPMDQGVINDLKLKYRKFILAHVLEEDAASLNQQIKKIKVKNAMYWLPESWGKIKPETKNSWNNILTTKDFKDNNKKKENQEHFEIKSSFETTQL
ncbi:hypothetical protein AVEN_204107-1 [Araneus ventricosus]|uniref:DDE-1 domain-containing protein n=1 Tax=Araneus ventricosus TaxID=182803 RepID=A0A4Y2NPK3_ARAVE|nr:hypothetical protein AVEN_204107-1 [Araneus ventricosus]